MDVAAARNALWRAAEVTGADRWAGVRPPASWSTGAVRSPSGRGPAAVCTVPAVLIESLVQSRPVTLRLLPAPLPGLPAGTLRGIPCRGRVTVDELTWAPGRLRARLVSPVAQRVVVHAPGGHRVVELAPDRPYEVAFG
ncbi:hypothetical protein ACFYON_24220 [Micromonospora sp. NPDC005686]|uniref:hypothetical protein n=1 Tax=unclassified Micromonospora TaxID=2617518 RepID=UPI0033C92037